MRDSNQTPPFDEPPSLPPPTETPPPAPSDREWQDAPPVEPAGPTLARPLLIWLALLLAFGAGGVWLGQIELAILAAFAGLFIAAQAADADRNWREIDVALAWVVPALGFMVSLAIGATIWQSGLPTWQRAALVAFSSLGAGLALLSIPRMSAEWLARVLFREPQSTRTQRLAARCVAITLVLALPGWFAAQQAMASLLADNTSLMDQAGLSGGLVGYVLLAFAGVGWQIRRNFRATAERLGLRVPGWRDLVVGGVALAVLWGLNNGADSLQARFFPALWASDRRVSEAIGAHMSPARAVLLGLSAGIGEEITLRGGLQPRLGILLTSAFFAALHVQYSWFGMLVIFVLGIVLGIVRKRASTSAAILTHVAYDVIAVLGGQ